MGFGDESICILDYTQAAIILSELWSQDASTIHTGA